MLLEAALATLVLAARAPAFSLLRCLSWISVAGIVYLIAAAAVLASPDRHRPSLRWIALAAVVFRLTLLPLSPSQFSSQAARFRWDGKIQQAGFNPYAYAPRDDLFKPIRGAADGQVAEPAVAAFHPPLAEHLFRWNYDWFHGVRGLKLLYTLLDLALIGLLVRMLKRRGQPPEWVLLYAWSPLAVFEVAGNGHLEPAAVLMAMLALHWAGRRMRGAALAAASAGMTLWAAWLWVPTVLAAGWRRWKSALACLLAWSALLALPFLFINQKLVFARLTANLRAHAALPPYNASLYSLVQVWFGGRAAAIAAGVLVAAVVVASLWRRLEPLRAAYLIVGTLLLAAPQIHAWTVLLLLPFTVFFPEAAWLYFSVAVLWSYLVAGHALGMTLEYAPLYALLAWQAWRPRRGRPSSEPA